MRLDALSVLYNGERHAVDQVSLRVKPGEIISLVGESGSGKSTLLHAVLGLLPRNASRVKGGIRLLGQDIAADRGKWLKQARGKEVAMIFQDAGRYLNPAARIGAQYREFLRSHQTLSAKECDECAEDMLAQLHLKEPKRILKSYPFELSGGMCQRVSIAMAMTLRPRLLLADEPTSALDVTTQAQVVRQMQELREQYGTSIVLVTHNIGIAAYLSDYIGIMQKGKLVEWGRAETLIDSPKHTCTKELLDAAIELGDKRFANG